MLTKTKKSLSELDAELAMLKAKKLLEDAKQASDKINHSNGLVAALFVCIACKSKNGTIDDVIKDINALIQENAIS